jgi:hypothetical protein
MLSEFHKQSSRRTYVAGWINYDCDIRWKNWVQRSSDVTTFREESIVSLCIPAERYIWFTCITINACMHGSARQVVKGQIPLRGKAKNVPRVVPKPRDWEWPNLASVVSCPIEGQTPKKGIRIGCEGLIGKVPNFTQILLFSFFFF